MEERLARVLEEKGLDRCKCGRIIDRGDVAWNEAATEAGTDYTTVIIQCQACDEELLYVHSWWPWVDGFDEVIDIIEDET